MRFLIAGILGVVWSVVCFAQARGEVESIGFGGIVRPGCWTPMVIRLTPTTGNNFEGRIEVVQEDLDRDNVIFTRQIVLQGNSASGGERAQTFWMYFIPQPNRGERSQISGSTTRDELNKIIKVRLTSDSGKELAKLPITQTVTLADELGKSNTHRGQKIVLSVGKEHFARFDEYQQMSGLTEDVTAVTVGDLAKGLPDDVIGYDGIDAIVWSDANPEELNLNPTQLTALQDYVRRGGRLVVLQDTQANQTLRNNKVFGSMMPVDVTGLVEEKTKPTALRAMAKVDVDPNAGKLERDPVEADRQRDRAVVVRNDWWKDRGFVLMRGVNVGDPPFPIIQQNWDKLEGPFKKATCTLRAGSQVAYYDPSDASPFIVRAPYGAGCVTWVAQNLADKQLQGTRFPTIGWASVWDQVMDWPNEPVHLNQGTAKNTKEMFASHVTVETGKALLKYMDLPSTSAALIGIAVLFFIVYWVAAGPGSFLVLARKKKTHMSWFAFGVLALAGTAMTYLIVKLVLRGDAKVQHITFVKQTPGEAAIVHSDFGLYIPRDGAQKIELKGTAEGKSSYVTAYNVHPAFVESDTDFPAKQDYYVPVKSVVEKEKGKENLDPKVIKVPFRSTLKKLQAQWVGPVQSGGVFVSEPIVLATDRAETRGKVSNRTGKDLRMVYLCVHHPGNFATRKPDDPIYAPRDLVYFIPSWPNGGQVDLSVTFALNLSNNLDLNNSKPQRGVIELDRGPTGQSSPVSSWTEYWYRGLRAKNSYTDKDLLDDDPLNPRSLPIVSFFDRLPPAKNQIPTSSSQGDSIERDRIDLLRRGVRHLDMSATISAGNMAIIAVSDTKDEKLPFPLEVDGDKSSDAAKGVIYYQFVVPVDRSKVGNRPPQLQQAKPAPAPVAPPTPATSGRGAGPVGYLAPVNESGLVSSNG